MIRAQNKYRVHTTHIAVAVLVVVLFALTLPGHVAKCLDPDLGDWLNLRPPDGNRVCSRVFAEGVQIYRGNGTSWVFVAPEADLSANPGGTGIVGIHYAGPTWESLSGSKVVGTVEQRCTVDADDIQWLLLRS